MSRARRWARSELLAYAKVNPGRLYYGSAGVGATNHIAVEQFKALAGVEITHALYKGSGPLIIGRMGNEVQLALLDFSSAQAGLKGGQLASGAGCIEAQANGWELVGGAPKALDDTVAQDYAESPGLIKRLEIKTG